MNALSKFEGSARTEMVKVAVSLSKVMGVLYGGEKRIQLGSCPEEEQLPPPIGPLGPGTPPLKKDIVEASVAAGMPENPRNPKIKKVKSTDAGIVKLLSSVIVA